MKNIFETYKELDGNIVFPIDKKNGMTFDKVILLGKNALYADCRFKVIHDDYKTLDSRHSDDGEEYWCEISDIIWVNHSGRFIVTKDDYNSLYESDKNIGKEKCIVKILLADNDVNFLGESVEIRTIKFSDPISPIYFDNSIEIKQNFINEIENKVDSYGPCNVDLFRDEKTNSMYTMYHDRNDSRPITDDYDINLLSDDESEELCDRLNIALIRGINNI